MSETPKPMCKGKVWGEYAYHHCNRRATTEAGYCKRCDPDKKAQREKVRAAKWQARADENDRVEMEGRAREKRRVEAHETALELARAVLESQISNDYTRELASKVLSLAGEPATIPPRPRSPRKTG